MSEVLEDLIVVVSPSSNFGAEKVFNDFKKVEALLENHGATVSKSVTKKVTHVCASNGDDGEALKKARAFGIPVVSLAFFIDSVAIRNLQDECEYGVEGDDGEGEKKPNPKKRKLAEVKSESNDEDDGSEEIKQQPKLKKVKKEESAPEPKKLGAVKSDATSSGSRTAPKSDTALDSEIPSNIKGKVYTDKSGPWSTSLQMTEGNHNKYYVIQLIEANDRKYYVFTKWGRIGLIGSNALFDTGGDLDAAKSEFEKKFREKTKNKWEDKAKFQHYAGKYEMMAAATKDIVPTLHPVPQGLSFPINIPGGRGSEYVIKLSGAGEPYCSCPGWKFNKDIPKTCKHLKTLAEPDGMAQLGATAADGATPAPNVKLNGGNGTQAASGSAKNGNGAAKTADLGHYHMPMKLEHIDFDVVEKYLKDDNWVAEQKVDGIRCTATVAKNGDHSFGSGTGAQLVSATAAQHFTKIIDALPASEEDYTLDGELMWTGEYHVFDILRSGDKDVLSLTMEKRRNLLETLWDHIGFEPPIYLLPQAKDTTSKRALLKKIEKMGGEGIVLKLNFGKYKEGARSREQLKVKFRKTADCIITARNKGGKSNAVLAVYENKTLRQVGQCSMLGKPDAQPGDVVEVAYLYATDAMILYQPSLVRIRTDKLAKDCDINQLIPVNKRVLVDDDLNGK